MPLQTNHRSRRHHHRSWRELLVVVGISTFCWTGLLALNCSGPSRKQAGDTPDLGDFNFDASQAKKDLEALTTAPHPFGSDEQTTVANYINHRLTSSGLQVFQQAFTAETPNPILLEYPGAPANKTIPRSGSNLFSQATTSRDSCIVLLGSHYDTKTIANTSYLGANDSGSSTVALIQILTELRRQATATDNPARCAVGGVFFDGEESILPEWNDGLENHPAKIIDNRYGSRHFVAQLQATKSGYNLPQAWGGLQVKALILMDMIGSPNVALTIDTYSDDQLVARLRALDSQLFTESIIHPGGAIPIDDDHRSFLDQGIPAIDLIDFHHRQHWHQPTDTIDNISTNSIAKVAKLALALALEQSK